MESNLFKTFDETLMMVDVDLIDTSCCILRTAQTGVMEYEELKASIREDGLLSTLLCRFIGDGDGRTISLIDGLNRLSICQELGVQKVPCKIRAECTNEDALLWQILANLQGVKTPPAKYGKAMKALLGRWNKNGRKTSINDLAKEFKKSPKWVKSRLKLAAMNKNVQPYVDSGDIKVNNAILLARLPNSEQGKWVEDAKACEFIAFKALILDRLRTLKTKNARKKGINVGPYEPPVAYRSIKDIRSEMETHFARKDLLEDAKNKEAAFDLALQWVTQTDRRSLDDRKAEYRDNLKEEQRKREQRLTDRRSDEVKKLEEKIEKLKKG